MKINDLLGEFSIHTSNEEKEVLAKVKHPAPMNAFPEREQFVIEALIRKALITKVDRNGMTVVVANESD